MLEQVALSSYVPPPSLILPSGLIHFFAKGTEVQRRRGLGLLPFCLSRTYVY